MKTVLAIAWNTIREIVRHPAYYLSVGIFAVFIVASYWLSDFHMQADVTGDVLQMGIASMIDCAVFLTVLASSKVVYDEIEKKTVLTIMSKPVTRARFLLGKYAGILGSTGIALAILLAALAATVCIHDARSESVLRTTDATIEAIDLAVRGAALALCEASILAAVAVALSVWFPFEVTGISLVAFFFVGHMSERVRSYFEEQGWTWVGKSIYYLVPNLEDFSIDRAIATGSSVSNVYLGWAFAYGLAVTAAILLVALALFRERELA